MLAALMICCGCGGSPTARIDAQAQAGAPAGPSTAPGAPAHGEIAGLPAPPGVRQGVWRELTTELSRVLRQRELPAWRKATGLKAAAAAPLGDASITTLSYDEESDTLAWGYYSSGDYDQNGLVGISDLTPLGIHFGKSSGTAGEPFPAESIESVVDGDGNGVINIADVTPIGMSFGVRVEGYRVYRSASLDDWPEDAAGTNGSGAELVDEMQLTEASAGGNARRMFALSGIEPPPAGDMLYWVRPYDPAGEGIASLPVLIEGEAVVGPPTNFVPIAVLLAAPFNGLAPLTVEFQAFSSADIDGEIVKYEWDFDGPINGENWVDTGLEPFAEHTYYKDADYLATLRVTDDEGATVSDVFPIRVRTPIPPGASMLPSATEGDALLHVVLDGSESDDFDGWIVDYSWDWNDDGVMDYSSGVEPRVDFYFYEPGYYWLTMQVTDNDGLSSIFRQDFRVDPGAVWQRNVAIASHAGSAHGHLAHRMSGDLIQVLGTPAFFSVTIDFDAEPQYESLHYTRALDAYGSAWTEPVFVYEADNLFHSGMRAGIVKGNPAGVFSDYVINSPTIGHYVRASNPEGSVWGPASTLGEGYTEFKNFYIAGGKPAFFMTNDDYVRASDEWGMEWEEPYDFPVLSSSIESYAMVNDRPSWFNASPTVEVGYFMQALDEAGSSWPTLPVLIEDVFENSVGDYHLLEVEGKPTVTFFNSIFRRLMITHAADAAGTSWLEPVTIAYWLKDSAHRSAIVDQRPAVVFTDLVSEQMMFCAANDAAGRSWGLPVALAPDEIPVEMNSSRGLSGIGDAPGLIVERTEPDPQGPEGATIFYIEYVNYH
jgi:PKD repeat protein